MKLACIALGGAAGALLRYGMGGAVQRFSGGVFPWGTMFVNLAGSFLIGLLAAMLAGSTVSDNVRAMVLIGLLGAFTTFSTFSYESVKLLQDRQHVLALVNVLASCAAGLAMVLAGFATARWLGNMLK